MTFLRFLILLSLVIWLGALVFFPVVAASAFSTLPSAHLAGLIVRSSLLKLHWMGLVCGVLFLICSLIYNRTTLGRAHVFAFGHILMSAMLALTAVSQFSIIPRMETLRLAAGETNSRATIDPIRTQFNSLHVWATRLDGTVLVLGVVLLYLTARRLATMRT